MPLTFRKKKPASAAKLPVTRAELRLEAHKMLRAQGYKLQVESPYLHSRHERRRRAATAQLRVARLKIKHNHANQVDPLAKFKNRRGAYYRAKPNIITMIIELLSGLKSVKYDLAADRIEVEATVVAKNS